jgi:hypothetical protein
MGLLRISRNVKLKERGKGYLDGGSIIYKCRRSTVHSRKYKSLMEPQSKRQTVSLRKWVGLGRGWTSHCIVGICVILLTVTSEQFISTTMVWIWLGCPLILPMLKFNPHSEV